MSEPQFLPVATTIARQAGAILMEHQGKVAIEYKGSADLVTAADRASEKFIVGRLRELFPDHSLIAEEGSRTDASSGYRWYIDPLDGTTNFAHCLPWFAVSMGLERDGKMVAGVVYNPRTDEMFAAEEGCGATLNGEPIQVSATNSLDEVLVATGFPSHKRHESPNIHFYQAFTLCSHGVRRFGSAALDLCYTACGRFDGFWEINLKPWDVAAGAFIVEQAGGRMSDMLGAPWRIDSPDVLASNGHVHGQIVDLFGRIFAGETTELASAAAYRERRLAGLAAPRG